jgi:hypothetical protein
MISSPLTAVYNPRAFIPHAASLGHAFAHCRRFSTAATRRCLGSISVPVVGAMLSHPLGISGLVGRYPANYLVPRKPLPRRNLTICSPDHRARRDRPVLPGVSPGYPGPGGTLPTPYYPVSRSSSPRRGLVARLACLIHAANVHSEPGSNPSERSLHPTPGNPTRRQAAGAGEKANQQV